VQDTQREQNANQVQIENTRTQLTRNTKLAAGLVTSPVTIPTALRVGGDGRGRRALAGHPSRRRLGQPALAITAAGGLHTLATAGAIAAAALGGWAAVLAHSPLGYLAFTARGRSPRTGSSTPSSCGSWSSRCSSAVSSISTSSIVLLQVMRKYAVLDAQLARRYAARHGGLSRIAEFDKRIAEFDKIAAQALIDAYAIKTLRQQPGEALADRHQRALKEFSLLLDKAAVVLVRRRSLPRAEPTRRGARPVCQYRPGRHLRG